MSDLQKSLLRSYTFRHFFHCPKCSHLFSDFEVDIKLKKIAIVYAPVKWNEDHKVDFMFKNCHNISSYFVYQMAY